MECCEVTTEMKTCKIFFLNHLSSYLNSLADALSQMGHQVFYHTSWNMREVEAGIAYFRPDILITAGIDKPMFHPDLAEIPELCDKYNLFHIYWATEDGIHFEGISRPFTETVKPDWVWTIHPECVDKYRQYGTGADYLNFAFNPRIFPEKTDYTHDKYGISFVGTTHLETRTYRYDSLNELVFPLIKAGKDVNVWGLGWQDASDLLLREFGVVIPDSAFRGYLPYKRTSDVYRQSRIVLGVQNATDQVTQRTFEILGSGAFMIASRTEELERLFRDGEELVLSSSPEETLELVEFYEARPEERERIGRQARINVLNNHTFAARLAGAWPRIQQILHRE